MSTDRRPRRTGTLAALAGAALVAACNGTSSYLDATGAAGRAEATLGRWLTAAAGAVVLIVCIAILAGIARHRSEHNEPWMDATREGGEAGRAADAGGPRGEGQRHAIRSGLNWIAIGVAITIVVLIATFAGTMATLDAASHPPRAPSLTMEVIGHQWWWEVRYGDPAHPELAFTTANEVHLPVGEPVRVRLRTADVIHSFWLPQIAGKMDLVPGQVNEMWLQADRPGTSRGTCGEYCGLQHAVMALSVTAESPESFDRWARSRRAEAAPPASDEARIGQTVFTRSCGGCHAVAGTDALGRIGPDLTHVASRPTIGAGALENTPANLARWIVNAQAVKEGARMPAVPLDAAELRAVVAYIETLR
jgi:cytochrome c oxidase subunit 2